VALQYNRIRLGAPDYMVLDANTATPIDLGASTGGATLAYTASYLPIEIDQTILPMNAYKTKEDVLFSVSLVQETASLVAAAMSLGTDLITTTAAGPMTTPATPVITTGGTPGVATWGYQVIAVGPNGDSIPSIAGTVTTGNAALTTTNFNVITWTANAGAFLGYKVYRSASGGTPASTGLIATLGPGVLTFNDTGIVATAYTLSVANPTNSQQDQVFFGGRLAVPFHVFDWQVPKNDGTGNKWLGHLNRVFSSKAITIDYKRDKVTEVAKMELMALADTTQAVGRQAGWLAELSALAPIGILIAPTWAERVTGLVAFAAVILARKLQQRKLHG
jgi:hypothetical protein